MKRIFKLAAIICIVGLVACSKDDEPYPTDFSGGCAAVDMGITTKDGKPLKWASYNVGASCETGYGSYFSWGETEEKADYDWTKQGIYKWGTYDGDADPLYGMTKYTAGVEGGDGLTELQAEDDPATKNWGTKWRTPTGEEMQQLLDEDNCSWTWDDVRKGFVVKSRKNGNTIFLPAAGYHDGSDFLSVDKHGVYWTATVNKDDMVRAHNLHFYSEGHDYAHGGRCYGFNVRAVTEY